MKRFSLQTSFLLGFIVFVVIPIIIINILVSHNYRDRILENHYNKWEHSMEQIKVAVEDEIRRVSLVISVVANDTELMNLVEEWHHTIDLSKRFELASEIDKQLNYLFSFNPNVNSLMIFFDDGSHYFYRTSTSYSLSEIIHMQWFKQTLDSKGKVLQIGYGDHLTDKFVESKTLAMAMAPEETIDKNDILLVYIDVFSPILQNLELGIQGIGNYILYDNEGKIILESLKDNMHSIDEINGFDALKYNSNDVYCKRIGGYYIIKQTLNNGKWSLIYREPVDEVSKNVTNLLIIFYFVYFFVAISFSIYIFSFYKSSILPIRNLVSKMKLVEKGNLNIETEVKGPKEIKTLNLTFNSMMNRINNLICDRDRIEKEKIEEEIRALQAQINPHFIYNTLNTIKIMAIMTKANNIKKILDSFMKVIELTFKSKKTYNSIEEELEYLHAYIHIMKARYGAFFEVDFIIDNQVKKLKIMKMLLQPFIENSIVHGLQDGDDDKIIIKVIREEDFLTVTIEDNGLGMDKQMIEEMLTSNNNSDHIGIYNTKRRIELTYGNAYSLNIESKVGKYTKVTLLLPIIE
ncbi:cache domain-containing sensor histidine kinase [Vallitalea maricola]|uniref:Two-component system sensor histidine kinase YesM n=1 Tax=Vallitalea maricola TaxID=3074433 RepID=A0ACB5UJR2_9FIRM|nr:two-component system sensor histidine kinase YesM [Vallitalea sp. AN17-2]